MNKGLSFFRKLLCDMTHHKQFGSGMTAVNEVRRRKMFITDHIYILCYRWFYDIMCVMLSFFSLVYLPFFFSTLIPTCLISGLHFPGLFPYPVKASIRKSPYFFESNND